MLLHGNLTYSFNIDPRAGTAYRGSLYLAVLKRLIGEQSGVQLFIH